MRWLAALVLAGCVEPALVECGDLLCPLGSTCRADGTCGVGEIPDNDGDGVADALDNCIAAANAEQNDLDDDSLGDVCDNCPLTSNVTQVDIGDGDGVGDACDPHPVTAGDCIALLDTLRDPARFAENWQVIDSMGPAQVEPAAGAVRVRRGGPSPVRLAIQGLAPDLYAVQAFVTTSGDGVVSVFSNGDPSMAAATGYLCGAGPSGLYSPAIHTSYIAPATTMGTLAAFGTTPVGNAVELRLAVDQAPTLRVRCRVTYGLARGAGVLEPAMSALDPGALGLVIDASDVTLQVFAAYNLQSGACAPPIIR